MNSYHFDVGNSSTGPIGLCARVTAETKEEALEILKEALPEELKVPILADGDAIEYINVYFNADAITVQDSSDDTTEDDPRNRETTPEVP